MFSVTANSSSMMPSTSSRSAVRSKARAGFVGMRAPYWATLRSPNALAGSQAIHLNPPVLIARWVVNISAGACQSAVGTDHHGEDRRGW
jgi:hypothetical protein